MDHRLEYLKPFLEENKHLIEEDNFQELYQKAFDRRNLTTHGRPVRVSNGLTQLFEGCGVNVFEYLDEIPPGMFSGYIGRIITIPPGYTSIPVSCFEEAEVEEIILPDTVNYINSNSAFYATNCNKLILPAKYIFEGYPLFLEKGNILDLHMSRFTYSSLSNQTIKGINQCIYGRIDIYE